MTDELEPAELPADDAAPVEADIPEAAPAPSHITVRVTADGAGQIANGAIPDPNRPGDHVHAEGDVFGAEAETVAELMARGFVEVAQ